MKAQRPLFVVGLPCRIVVVVLREGRQLFAASSSLFRDHSSCLKPRPTPGSLRGRNVLWLSRSSTRILPSITSGQFPFRLASQSSSLGSVLPAGPLTKQGDGKRIQRALYVRSFAGANIHVDPSALIWAYVRYLHHCDNIQAVPLMYNLNKSYSLSSAGPLWIRGVVDQI